MQNTQIKRIGVTAGNERPQRIDRGARRRWRPDERRHRDRRAAGANVTAAQRGGRADGDVLERREFCRRDKTRAVNRRGAGERNAAGDGYRNCLQAQGKAGECQLEAGGFYGYDVCFHFIFC